MMRRNAMLGLTLGALIVIAHAQQPATVNCTAINQVFVDDPRAPKYFFLDLPAGATFTSGEYQARAASGGAWQSCSPAVGDWFNKADTTLGWQDLSKKQQKAAASGITACQAVRFSQIDPPAPKPDPADQTPHYFILVRAVLYSPFYGETYARMVLNYKMNGPSCAVQQTYYVDKGTRVDQLADLRVPAGKTITHEHTFARIDPPGPATNKWISCGTDQGSWPNGVSMYNGCLGTDAVGMQTQKLSPDGVDGAPGRTSACGANGWGGVGWCRVTLEYAP